MGERGVALLSWTNNAKQQTFFNVMTDAYLKFMLSQIDRNGVDPPPRPAKKRVLSQISLMPTSETAAGLEGNAIEMSKSRHTSISHDPAGGDGLLDSETAAELRRLREVAKYYCATPTHWLDETDPPLLEDQQDDNCALPAFPAPSFTLKAPQIAVDPSLAAYAQLGLLKLGCERSFISIIDHDRQYILAEATRSISLEQNDHEEGDGLFIGSQTLPVFWGVCPSTIKTFTDTQSRFSLSTSNITANQSRYIIRDFTMEEAFRSRPYVVGWPFMRFYAEVPLKNPSGFVIGSYCVVDNRPREMQSFGDKEVAVLQEISNTVSNHLELTRMKLDYNRAERMMKGLSYFVQGQSSIRASANHPSRLVEKIRAVEGETHGEADSKAEEGRQRTILAVNEGSFNESSAPIMALDRSESHTAVMSGSLLETNAEPSDISQQASKTAGKGAASNLGAAGNDYSTASNIKGTFQRASTLIRESMDLSGVIFLDAYYSNLSIPSMSEKQRTQSHTGSDGDASFAGFQQQSDAAQGSATGDHVETSIRFTSCSVGPGSTDFETYCEVLGCSKKLSRNPDTANLSLQVPLLHGLLKKYPQGRVFSPEKPNWILGAEESPTPTLKTFDDQNNWSMSPEKQNSPDDPQDSVSLFEVFPNACSIVFYPLWDSHKGRWCAGCLGWTTDPKRALQELELPYIAAFSHSLMAELGRLEAMATGKAKTDFISNISHELRSPLHGILASAELLQESSTGPDQDGMIEMVNSCGRTLLDTMNHLLDYAKINNFAKSKNNDEGRVVEMGNHDEQVGLVTDFDLREILEEVVEVVQTGYEFQRRQAKGFLSGNDEFHRQDDVRVILDIAHRADWVFNSQPGAWRRLIMNIFGNALKYTEHGFIKISIRAKDAVPEPIMVLLSITDTGKGISDYYLKHRLYTPFSQEDSLSVGAGLGLSIVQQIVQQMKGTIEIQSRIGVGTTVAVAIPLLQGSTRLNPPNKALVFSQLRKSLHGLKLCMVALDMTSDLEAAQGILTQSARQKLALKSSLSKCLTDWLGLQVVAASSIDIVLADIFLLEEDYITQLLESCSEEQVQASIQGAPIIVLSRGPTPNSRRQTTQFKGLTYLDQPYGPSKLARALKFCLSSRTTTSSASLMPQLKARTERKQPNIVVNGMHAAQLELSSAENDGGNDSPNTTPRVLLVDDNDINLKIMVIYMRKLNYSYATASNGLQAVETYQKEANAGRFFDTVLCDLSMPVMDGLTATRAIRAFEQSKQLTPSRIVALTGLGSKNTRQDASASGFDLFLTKPVPLKLVKEIVGNSRLSDRLTL